MKTTIVVVWMAAASITVQAQRRQPSALEQLQEKRQQQFRQERAAQSIGASRPQLTVVEPAEWRVVDGVTNDTSDWKVFVGEVLESHKDGLRLRNDRSSDMDEVIWIKNYPWAVADGKYIKGKAKRAGLFRYKNVLGGTVTIEQWDFGTPCEAPALTAEEIKQRENAWKATRARIEFMESQKAEAYAQMKARTVKYQLEQAEKGSPSFQYEVGKRYRDGDGVEKDETKARVWFEKSAAQGESLAVKALADIKK